MTLNDDDSAWAATLTEKLVQFFNAEIVEQDGFSLSLRQTDKTAIIALDGGLKSATDQCYAAGFVKTADLS